MDSPLDTYFIPNKNTRAIKYSLWLWYKWHDGNNWALVKIINLRVIKFQACIRGTLKKVTKQEKFKKISRSNKRCAIWYAWGDVKTSNG